MNFEQKYLCWSAGLTLWMIVITALIHWWTGNILILAITWPAMYFMNDYFWRIHLSPLDRSLGRAQGFTKGYKKGSDHVLVELKRQFEEKKKKGKSRRCKK